MVKIKNPQEIVKTITSCNYDKKRIFSIIAHIDHGKFSTKKYLMRQAGLISEKMKKSLGFIFDGDGEEIYTFGVYFNSVILLAFDDPRKPADKESYIFQINNDTCYISHINKGSSALRGSDGALIIVDVLEGIRTQTKTYINLAVHDEFCKSVLFINKVDRLITELKLTPEDVLVKINEIIEEVNSLIEKNRPKDSKWGVNFARNSVTIGSAKYGWGFTREILLEKRLKPQDVFKKYSEGNIKWLRENLPLDEPILRMVVDHLPDPVTAAKYRIPHIWGGDLNSELGQALLKSDPKGPLFGIISKIFFDPNKNYQAIIIGRVFSGTIDPSDSLYMINAKENHHIKRLGVMENRDILDIKKIPAGNIFASFGFIATSGETFMLTTDLPKNKEDIPSPFEKIQYGCKTVVSRSIKPRDPHDINKLEEVVSMWSKLDPTTVYNRDQESGKLILSGNDLPHLESLTNQINNQVEIRKSEPIIVYREKITRRGKDFNIKSLNNHNRIILRVEPLEQVTEDLINSGKISDIQNEKEKLKILKEEADWDTEEAKCILDIFQGNILVNATSGSQRFDQIKGSLVKAFRNWVGNSILTKEPATGIKVVITDIVIHEDPRYTSDNQISSMVLSALSLSMLTAEPHLFEPIQNINVKILKGTENIVSQILFKRRGQITNIIPEREYMRIQGQIPASGTIDPFSITDEILGVTQGRAFFEYEFSKFEKVPANLEKKLILHIRKRKGLKEELPNSKYWDGDEK